MKPIIITGGPGAGKTSIIDALSLQGFATFPESSRYLIEQQSQLEQGILPWDNLAQFAELCLEHMQRQKEQALQVDGMSFMDRAIPDIVAYLKLGHQLVPDHIRNAGLGYHAQVFVCRPHSTIYVQDEVRPHSFEQACEVHDLIIDIYTELGYKVIDVPWASIEQRATYIIQQLA